MAVAEMVRFGRGLGWRRLGGRFHFGGATRQLLQQRGGRRSRRFGGVRRWLAAVGHRKRTTAERMKTRFESKRRVYYYDTGQRSNKGG